MGEICNKYIAAIVNYNIGFSKYNEYKKVKKYLIKHGWNEKVVKPKMYSWCQRHVVRQAAKQTGNLEKFDDFVKEEEHKWYHFLPKLNRINEVVKFK